MEKNYNRQNDDIRKTVKNNPKGKKQTVNKKILLILALVVLIIVGIFIINKNKKIAISNTNIENYDYFVISSDGKFGVIDKSGNIVINPEYQSIQIPNPEKDVFICLYDYDNEKAKYSSKVLNKDSKEILGNYENVQAITNNNTSISNSYQSAILKYESNNKLGLITIDGKKITDAEYDSIETLEYKDNILKISKNGEYGLIELNGDEVIPAEYNAITADGYYNSSYDKAGYIVNIRTDEGYRYGYINYNGKQILDTIYTNIKRITEIKDDDNFYLITYKNGQAGLIKNGQTVIENEYEQLEYDSTSNMIMVQKNAKQGVMDLTGDSILIPQYEDITFRGILITGIKDGTLQVFDSSGVKQSDDSFISMQAVADGEYYITIDRNNKYGVCSKNRQVIISNEYSYVDYAFNNYFIVSKNGKLGVVDTNGNISIDVKYDIAQKINGTNLIQTINSETGVTEIYNNKLELILSGQNAKIYIEKDYIEIIAGNDIVYLDFYGNVKKEADIFSSNSIFASKKDGKWGYVDKNGNVVIDYKYDIAMNINEYGYGAIKKDGKWGVVSGDGKIIEEPTYELTDARPKFVGKYYRVSSSYEIAYYSDNK